MSVRGYAKWNPQGEAVHWVNCVNDVAEQYQEYWPLSVRQVFYRLVADHGYAKSEAAYGKLTQIISRARRAGYIKWQAIRDGGLGRSVPPDFYEGADDFFESVRAAAEHMRLDRQRGQDQVVELWCEAGGMVPILSGIAAPYTCRVNTGGGYDSVTAKHNLASRVRRRVVEQGLRTLVLHVGDFDGSGEDMCSVLEEDTRVMVVTQLAKAAAKREMDVPPDVAAWRDADGPSGPVAEWAIGFFDVERVALTGEQVVERGVETAPPKKTDSRTAEFVRRNEWVAEALGTQQITAQLEALTPPELNDLIREAIEAHLDMDVHASVLEEEEEIREGLLEKLDSAD